MKEKKIQTHCGSMTVALITTLPSTSCLSPQSLKPTVTLATNRPIYKKHQLDLKFSYKVAVPNKCIVAEGKSTVVVFGYGWLIKPWSHLNFAIYHDIL